MTTHTSGCLDSA